MGSDLQVGKVQFTKLMDIIKPVVMSQFIAWLDEKVAEFKVQGYMNLDTGTEAPKWIKDYSMSILVSGISFQSNEQHGRAADKSQHSKSQHSDNLHRPRDSDSVTSTRTAHRLSDVHHRTSERGSIMGSNVNNLSVSRKRSPECIIDDDDDDDDVVEVKRERVDGQELDSCSISESRDILSSLATEQNSPASIRRIPASPVLPLTTEAFPVHSRLSEVSVSTPDRTFSSIRSSPHKPMKDLPTIPSHSSSSPSAIPPTLAGATGTIPSRSPSRTLVQRSQLDSRTTISQASDLDMSVEDVSVVLDDNGDAVVEHSRILKKEPDQILQETDSRSSAGDFDPGPSTSQDDMALALVNPLSNPDNDDSIDDNLIITGGRIPMEELSLLTTDNPSLKQTMRGIFHGITNTRSGGGGGHDKHSIIHPRSCVAEFSNLNPSGGGTGNSSANFVMSTVDKNEYLAPGRGSSVCQFCPYQSGRPYNLKRHMSMHLQEMKFTCDECGAGFCNDYNLKQHKVNKHLMPYHICDVCSKQFESHTDLNIHCHSIHGFELLDVPIYHDAVMNFKEQQY